MTNSMVSSTFHIQRLCASSWTSNLNFKKARGSYEIQTNTWRHKLNNDKIKLQSDVFPIQPCLFWVNYCLVPLAQQLVSPFGLKNPISQ
jgi:hypothetical protein